MTLNWLKILPMLKQNLPNKLSPVKTFYSLYFYLRIVAMLIKLLDLFLCLKLKVANSVAIAT